jgi:hypothetical protein
MSGACKGSTISAELLKATEQSHPKAVMFSAIKNWKYYQFGLFKGLTEYNDFSYSILHLVRLREFMERNHETDNDLIVERGITDSMFYYYHNDEFKTGQTSSEDISLITDAVKQEKLLLSPEFHKVEKILLIQNDKNFVRDIVLQDPYRKKSFNNNPEYYLRLQDSYVNFTTRYNDIDKIVRIDDAKDYIENTLGQKFETEYYK